MAADELSTVLVSLLGDLPNVSIKKHINHTNFLIGEKVFAIGRDDSVVMKLPKDSVKRLVRTKNASPLAMGKRVMTEWVVIKHEDPNDFKGELKLLRKSMTFVASKARGEVKTDDK
ncbi:MAG TPA: hypothetical protein VMV68_04285 [Spirochaetia bacterium]|nr:hypothetical protein [Spirochaetia bacterium]